MKQRKKEQCVMQLDTYTTDVWVRKSVALCLVLGNRIS
jgi:hypothetical protein